MRKPRSFPEECPCPMVSEMQPYRHNHEERAKYDNEKRRNHKIQYPFKTILIQLVKNRYRSFPVILPISSSVRNTVPAHGGGDNLEPSPTSCARHHTRPARLPAGYRNCQELNGRRELPINNTETSPGAPDSSGEAITFLEALTLESSVGASGSAFIVFWSGVPTLPAPINP